MTSKDAAASALEHVSPITSTLHDTLAKAIARSEQRAAGIDHESFPYVRSLLVRTFARIAFQEGALPNGWRLEGQSRRMGELYLRKPGVMRLRLLKGNPLQPGGVPHAGPNRVRRQAWFQAPLPDPSLQIESDEHSFLLLWSFEDPSDRTSGFTLHLAHTLHPGKFGARVPCDLVLAIPQGGTMFEELGPFVNEEDVNLFETEVAILDEADE